MSRTPFVLPDLGVAGWPVKATAWFAPVGGQVIEGDRLLEVTVGDATVDLPAPCSGRLLEQTVREHEPLKQGQVLAWLQPE